MQIAVVGYITVQWVIFDRFYSSLPVIGARGPTCWHTEKLWLTVLPGDSSLSVSLSRISLINWYQLSSRRGSRTGRACSSLYNVQASGNDSCLGREFTRHSWR